MTYDTWSPQEGYGITTGKNGRQNPLQRVHRASEETIGDL